MKRTSLGVLFLMVGVLGFAQDNPFAVSPYVWDLETVHGTAIASLMFGPIISNSMGSVFIFPPDWEPDDPIDQVNYFLVPGNENQISFATSSNDVVTYEYDFLSDDHFVFFYPINTLNPNRIREVTYRARLVPDA